MRKDWKLREGALVLTSAVLRALGATLPSAPCLLTIPFLEETRKAALLAEAALLTSAPPLLTDEVVLKALDSIFTFFLFQTTTCMCMCM
jgi:hypothetical protein